MPMVIRNIKTRKVLGKLVILIFDHNHDNVLCHNCNTLLPLWKYPVLSFEHEIFTNYSYNSRFLSCLYPGDLVINHYTKGESIVSSD